MAAKPKLEYGSHGAAVAEAQAKLNVLMPQAAPPLVVDGKFGTMTAKRVQQFQMSRALAVDGIIGPRTWAALDGTGAPAPGGQPPAPPAGPSAKPARVRMGTRTICSCGTKLSSLRFAAQGRLEATVFDYFPYGNVGPFGTCHSPHNPAVQMHTQLQHGVFAPQPCHPVFLGPWTPGHPIEMAGTPPAPLLDLGSVLVCAYGGVVTIVPKK